MTQESRPFERSAESQSSAAFLDEERESFTQAFAYDHFQWPAFKVFGTARPTVMEFRTPAERAAEDRGLEGDDPAAPYTTANSPLAVYKTGYVVPVESDGTITPQTAQSSPLIDIDEFRADDRFDHIDGSGYAVVIIDTGIDLDDPFFGPDANGDGISDRIVYQHDFADNDSNASDVDGHGSNVASIAASSDSTYTGMAPGADIVALKVFSDSGSGHFGYVESSLQWVINNAAAYNIVSVNMSLGDGENYNTPIGLYGIADELAVLASMNVIVVSSSGNGFYELNSVQGVAYPSADPNSLSVGAVYDGNTGGWEYESGAIAYTTGADRITPFSQRDDQLTDIFAPGAVITGAGAGAGLVSIHGTSQAAPHIAGIVALAQQLAVEVLGRKLTYDEFTDLLSASADIVIDGDDENDNVANTGLAFPRVNVAKLGEAIVDMAEPNSFSISALSAVKAEGDGGSTAFTFTVTRSGYSGGAASVGYSVSGGTASGADFAGNLFPAGTVSFAAGQTSKTLTILVKGDVLIEGNESFTVSLSNPSGDGTIGTGSADGLIINDDAAPPSSSFAIAAADAVKLEGDSGSTAFTFTVTRSGDTGQAGAVSYSVGGGAVDGADFAGGTLPAGTLSFAAGEISKTVTVTVRGDTDAEADEAFTVTLANPSANATIAVATAGGIVANDDAGPGDGVALLQADFDAAGDTEGFQYRDGLFGGTFFQRYASGDWEDQALRVRLGGVNNNIGRDLSGGWQTDFVVGEAGEVELSFRYNLSIGADYDGGEYSQVLVSIDGGAPILVDRLDGDGNDGPQQTTGMKSVVLALGALSAGTHSLEIGSYNNQKSWRNEETELLIDDVAVTGPGEPPPPAPSGFAIAALDAVRAEGDAGGTAFTFTVTRSGDASTAAAVDYAVSGAADGGDFVGGLPSGTLVFLTGETSKTLAVTVAGDTAVEADEDFTVTLLNPSAGAEIATASAAGTILNDDDAAPAILAITANDPAQHEGDAGSTPYSFTVTRSDNMDVAATVDYGVIAGDAESDDFAGGVLPSGTLSFAAGENSKTFTVSVAGDTAFEPAEYFVLGLSNPSVGATVSTGGASSTILNDDPAPPSTILAIFAESNFKDEGDSGATLFTFRVQRSGDTTGGGSVDYSVAGNTNSFAVGDDFVGGILPTGTLTFAADETEKLFAIEVQGDTEHEGPEGFLVTLSNPTDGMEIAPAAASAVGTILNDDAASPSTFSIAARHTSRAEGNDGANTPFAFEITRTGDTAEAGSVYFEVTSSQADGSDFTNGVLHSGRINFPAGENFNVVTLTIWAVGDNIAEADEVFTVTLSDPSAGFEITTASASATILNDDGAPAAHFAIAAEDAVKAEGDAGATDYAFTVTRSGDTSAAGSVDWSVSGGDPDAADFGGSLPGGTVSFAAGETSKTVTVQVSGDTDFEADEDFTVILSNPSAGSEITTASAQGTILNDDPAPPATFYEIAALDAAKAEGDSGVTLLGFTIARSGDLSFPATVGYSLAGAGTDPAESADFASGLFVLDTATFSEGQASVTIDIRVAGDTNYEADEGFVVSIFDPTHNGAIVAGKESATGTVLNDDPLPVTGSFSIAALDAAQPEGDAGTTLLTFTVARSGDSSGAATVDYALTSGGPNAIDFAGGVLPGGTLTFAAGESSQTLSVAIQGDTTVEPDESFTITLSNPSPGNDISVPTAVGTILNDDVPPPATFLAITALDADKTEGDAGTTAFTFTVTRTGDTSAAGSIDYAVTGTADGSDFAGGNLPGGTVSFAAGEASKTLTLEVAGDTAFEADEDFTVTLSNASAGSEIITASAAGTIENDDPAPPATFLAIAALDAAKAEGDAGSTAFTFTVTRSGDSSAAGSVGYAVTGSADGGDFLGGTLPSGTVFFAAGETSKTLTLEVAGDTAFEAEEGFTVTLSNASAGSAITTASAAGAIVNDDPTPPTTFLAIAADEAVKEEGLINETFLSFTVTRSGDTSVAGTVDYAVSGEVDGDDFVGGALPSGTLGFAPGETSRTLSFNVAGDGDEEPDETFTVTLSNASAGSAIATASAAGTILNDDGPPEPPAESLLSIEAVDAVKSEGDDGTTLFTFIVSRPGTVIGDASVDYTVTGSGGNPAGASDFAGGVLPSGTVTIQGEGASSATIVIEVAGDSDIEDDEGFTVTLSNPSAGATIVTASADGTVLNDDAEDPTPGEGVVILAADFDSPGDTEGFVYSDGVFTSLSFQTYAAGSWEDQALTIDLGGMNNRIGRDIAGAWETDFTLSEEMGVSLSLDYDMLISEDYDSGEFSRLLVSIDGGSAILIEELVDGGPLTASGSVTLDLGSLGAGSHSLAIGGYNNQKSWSNEFTEISIDDVLLTGTPAPAGAPIGAPDGGLPPGSLPGFADAGMPETELQSLAGF